MTRLNGVYELRFAHNLELTPLTQSLDVLRVSLTAKLLSICQKEHMTLLSRRKGTCLTNHVQSTFLLPAWAILILIPTLQSVSTQSNACSLHFSSPDTLSKVICREFVNDGELRVNRALLETFTNPARNLQELVNCLQNQETLIFEGSTLQLRGLEIVNSIAIQGSSRATTSIGCLDEPLFRVDATGVKISNLEVHGCRLNSADAPVVLLSESSVEFNSVNFTNNTNKAGSAALKMETDSELVIDNCHFTHNSGRWSTLNVTDGNTLTISSSSFVNNTSHLGGGALTIESEQKGTKLVINSGSQFKDNEATAGEGGAILAIGNVSLTIKGDTTFRGNKAANQGGALFVRGSSTVKIVDAFFIENESDFIGGGAIYAENSEKAELDVHISATTFSRNAAKNQLGSGGAIRLQGAAVTCTIDSGVSFISNIAELDGGAIHVSEGSTMTIRATSFIGNEVHHGGGAALFALSSLYSGSRIRTMSLRIESSLFVQNRVVKGQRGGGTLGFASLGTEIEIEGCRFDGNEAELGSGGVLYLYDGPFATVKDSSFKDNKAIWGGVMFGEKRARYSIHECIFHRNQAEEGGVAKIRGAINVDIKNSDIRNNSAVEDGGAIRAENHVYDGGDRARFRFENSTVVNNLAGDELRQEGFGSSVTRGGGIAVTGAGQYVEIVNSTFRNNSASEGGAIAAIGPAQFLMTGQSHFEDNLANFGGALFIFVNNQIDILGDLYRISDATFVNNSARSEGGAVRLSSSTSANNLFPYNAARRTVRFQDCVIRRNRALNNGGGMMVTGVGLELQNVEFIRNNATLDPRVTNSGHGGGIAAMDGASIRISGGNIRDNVAYVSGGGLFVTDSSVAVFSSNFTRNRVRGENGNGGAVALLLTSSRMIPRIETGPLPYPVLFRCNDCRFARNNASVHGGAIYHHHSDPTANYSETWNCENLDVTTFDQFRTTQDFDLTCVWINQTADLLRNRHIRLFRVQFIRNEAQSGAGIFTNYPDMINVTDGNLEPLGVPLRQALKSTVLNESGITFTDNTISDGGYGPNYASLPRHAYMIARESPDNRRLLFLNNVRLGDFLRFRVEFQDAFHQRVTRFDNISAEFVLNNEESGNLSLPVSGQTVGQTDNDGIIRFTGTRLQGNISTAYKLSLRFFYAGQELRMNEALRIDITMRSCRIGQEMNTEQGSRRCEDCGTGEFNADPMGSKCESCGHDEGKKCSGIVAVPENHYWHTSSLEIKVYRCIGREACQFKDRSEIINETEFNAHINNINVSYEDYDNYQCAKGYHGILCGSCRPGYGREGESCRDCASIGISYLLLSLLILWSIGFVAYFVRTVLQVSNKIEFNKKFGGSPTHFPSKKGPRDESLPISLPETDAFTSVTVSTEIQPDEQDDPSVGVSTPLRRISTDAMHEQTLFINPTVTQTRRDLARAMANAIDRKRTACRFERRAESASTLRRSTKRKQATLSTRFRQLKSDSSTQTIEPLNLANPFSEALKVLINFLQVTSVAVKINLEWSDTVRSALMSIGSAANMSTGSGFFSLDCFLESGSVPKALKRVMMTTLFPAALLILFIFLWGIYAFIKKRTLKYFLQRSWVTTLAIVYFFYIIITENLLRFFACVNIEEEHVGGFEDSKTNASLNGYYWEEDTSVQCYKDKHALLVITLAVPLLCLVTIGFPSGTLVILRVKTEHLEDEDVVGTYGFLYQAYNEHYWEIIIMLRKASIAAVVVFVYALEANMQGLLCVLVLMVSLSLHLSFVPFKKEMHRLNYLETCSLSTSIAVFVSGLMFNDRVTNRESEIFLSVFAILCIVVTLCFILINLVLSAEEFLDMKLLELQVMDKDDLLYHGIFTKIKALLSHYCDDAKSFMSFSAKCLRPRKNSEPQEASSIQMGGVSGP